MPRRVRPPISRAEVLEAARRLAGKYGEALTVMTFQRETGIGSWHVFRLFGSWRALRRRVGLPTDTPRSRPRRTAAEIQKALREAVARHGEDITQMEFARHTGISSMGIARHFRNWGQLRASIGLPRRARIAKRYSDHDLLADLWRVAGRAQRFCGTPPHRCPTITQQNRFGTICGVTIRDRYGNWRNVRLAFEIYRRTRLWAESRREGETGEG